MEVKQLSRRAFILGSLGLGAAEVVACSNTPIGKEKPAYFTHGLFLNLDSSLEITINESGADRIASALKLPQGFIIATIFTPFSFSVKDAPLLTFNSIPKNMRELIQVKFPRQAEAKKYTVVFISTEDTLLELAAIRRRLNQTFSSKEALARDLGVKLSEGWVIQVKDMATAFSGQPRPVRFLDPNLTSLIANNQPVHVRNIKV